MYKLETDLKCKGCSCDSPKDVFVAGSDHKPSWFCKYRGCKIVEWICHKCWDNGVRYSEVK